MTDQHGCKFITRQWRKKKVIWKVVKFKVLGDFFLGAFVPFFLTSHESNKIQTTSIHIHKGHMVAGWADQQLKQCHLFKIHTVPFLLMHLLAIMFWKNAFHYEKNLIEAEITSFQLSLYKTYKTIAATS